MPDLYHIETPDEIFSPALVVFRPLVIQNIEAMIRTAGDAARLRPHCKTHKMAEVIKLELERGIHKHKAATFAEAEMLAQAGVKDILLAYNVVGPNIRRAVAFCQTYPDAQLLVTADDAAAIQQLGAAMQAAGQTIGVALDVNPGRDRTGVPVGEEAKSLYRLISETAGLEPAGFHLYDGHQGQSDADQRRAAVHVEWDKAIRFRDDLLSAGLSVPRIVGGGTPQFPIYAALDDPTLELSPGTTVFHDCGYGESYTDLTGFTPAALILTRVISRPTKRRVTLDVGTKAVASDPPMGQRLILPTVPDAKQVLHNEEHLVVETDQADRFRPGDWLLAIPRHICPTSALYREATVIDAGQIVATWSVTARDRQLMI